MFSPRRLALFAGLFALVLNAHAQLNVILALDFDNASLPWASTGGVTLAGALSAPTISNAQLAPIPGNVKSAYFAGAYAAGVSDFTGVNPATTGFGVELWVKNPVSLYSDYTIITSFGHPYEAGISIKLQEGAFDAITAKTYNDGEGGSYVANGYIGTAAVGGAGSINGWDHLALVSEGSTTTFYVNGNAIGSTSDFAIGDDFNSVVGPNDGWHLFVTPGGDPSFGGWADGLKYFTYTPGTFSASLLDYAAAAAIPEPSTYAALAGLAALGVAIGRRRSAV